jgi:hypothetical protein
MKGSWVWTSFTPIKFPRQWQTGPELIQTNVLNTLLTSAAGAAKDCLGRAYRHLAG